MQSPPLLPGVFYMILIGGCVLALPLSFLLISLYKKALVKGMGYTSVSFTSADFKSAPVIHDLAPATDINLVNISDLSDDSSKIYFRLKETLGYHWFVYGAMVLVFATIISGSFLQSFGTISFWRLFYCILIFSFPYVHISEMLLANGWKQKMAIYLVVFFMYFALLYIIWSKAATNGMTFWTALIPVFIYNAIPAAIIILFRSGKIKAVGMFVLSFIMVSVSGPALFSFYMSTHPESLETLGMTFIRAGFSANLTVLVWIIISLSVTIVVGWIFINRIKAFYTRKWINDIQLTADSYLLLFNFTYSIFIFFESPKYALVSLLAFPAYKITGLLFLFFLRKRKVKKVSPRMLLLRVFALGDDSKNLFERVLKHWRYAGSIQMISGPDLAAATVEPHEIVSFVSGNLKDSFCEGADSILENIAKIDSYPDLDGTHRVNEFFCRDNNWKYVLRQLVMHSDTVLMDLRSFSDKFAGCRYEIEALVNMVSLNRIIFIVDTNTDIDFTRQVFTKAIHSADNGSVNRMMPQNVTLYKIESHKDKDVSRLLNLLCSKIE